MTNEQRQLARSLYAQMEALRDGEDYLIVSIGARGPNVDMPDGNAVATVRMGDEEASAGAKYLDDAITLARDKIVCARKAREAARAKAKELAS